MVSIIKRELKANIKGLILWTIIISLVVIMMIGSFEAMKNDMEAMNELMKSLPQTLLKAFGMESLDMNTIEGFYASKGHLTTALVGTIYAVYLSSSLLVKEEDQKTSEYLLSKPISRKEVYLSKAISFFIIITLFDIIISGVMALGIYSFVNNSVDGKVVLLLGISPYILHLTFGYLCYFLSVFFKKLRSSLGMALGIVFLSYILSVLGNITDSLSFLKDVSFFSYVDINSVVIDKSIGSGHLIVMAITLIISLILGKIIYERKDF